MADAANRSEDYGVQIVRDVYFRNEHKARTFRPFHEEDDDATRGLVPPRDKIYEHADSPKENCNVVELERVAKELGCVAFASQSETWVPSASSAEILFVVADNAPPWHHVDIFYDVQENLKKDKFESFSVEVEFSHDVPTSHNLYLCIFGGHSNLGGFYGGFQTNVGCPGDTLGQSSVPPAPGLIFSRWGPALPEDVCLTSAGSFREVDTYEGSFASVRHHYPWKKGRYKLSLASRTATEDGVWVDFHLEDFANGAMCEVGGLFFRGKEALLLGSRLYSFIEIYGPTKRYLDSTFPQFTVSVCNMYLNGTFVDPTVRALYYKESPLYVTAYTVMPDNETTEEDEKWRVDLRFGTPFGVNSYGERRLRESRHSLAK